MYETQNQIPKIASHYAERKFHCFLTISCRQILFVFVQNKDNGRMVKEIYADEVDKVKWRVKPRSK